MTNKSLGFIDIDNTAYHGFLMMNLIIEQNKAGILAEDEYAQMVELYEAYHREQLGYIDLVKDVLKLWAKGLVGQSEADVKQHTAEYLQGEGNKFYDYIPQILESTKDTHNAYFVTAEPQFVAEVVTEMFGAKGHISSEFEVSDGVFTGEVNCSLASGEDKLYGLSQAEGFVEGSFAIGDSIADAEMLSMVDLAVCINPSQQLREVAERNEWLIVAPEDAFQMITERLPREGRPPTKERA